MSNRPFFSVVVPTKNRSFLVKDALESVRRQSFPEWEAVVVDNDDSDATAKVVTRLGDPRIRHVRTGGLSMPDNWERGCREARGEYVCIIEDKQALHADALATLHDTAERHPTGCIHWLTDVIDDTTAVTFLNPAQGTGTVEDHSSDHILELFTREGIGAADRLLPLGHYCALRRTLIEKIGSGPTGRLCYPMAPDYTMAFLILNELPVVTQVDRALVVGSRKNSNGRDCGFKRQAVAKFLAELGKTEADTYERTLMKAFTVPNLIYNDYLSLQHLVGNRLARHPLEPAVYFAECRRSIIYLNSLGVNQRPEAQAWQQALEQQPAAVRGRVRELLSQTDGPLWLQAAHEWFKRWRSLSGLRDLEVYLKIKSRQWRGRKCANQFKTAFEYAEWAAQGSRKW